MIKGDGIRGEVRDVLLGKDFLAKTG